MCFDDTGDPCAVALCGRITGAIEAASKIASRESPVAKHVKRNLPAEKHSCQVHARCRLHWFPEASLSDQTSNSNHHLGKAALLLDLPFAHHTPDPPSEALSWHLWRRLCCFRRCFRSCFGSWLSRRCLQKMQPAAQPYSAPNNHILDYRNPKSYDRHCTCGN